MAKKIEYHGLVHDEEVRKVEAALNGNEEALAAFQTLVSELSRAEADAYNESVGGAA